MRIIAEPLAAKAFQPFGQVLEAPRSIERWDWVAALGNRRPDARPNLALIRSAPVALPFRIEMLERHAFSSQTFLPLAVGRYLVVVCPDDGHDRPYLPGMKAFIADGHQGINYAPGTWHHNMGTLGAPGDFAMLIWENGSDGDCTFQPLGEGFEIHAPASAPFSVT